MLKIFGKRVFLLPADVFCIIGFTMVTRLKREAI